MSTTDPSERPFDLIVYGATGFTGGLVADYLARKSALAPEKKTTGWNGGSTPSGAIT